MKRPDPELRRAPQCEFDQPAAQSLSARGRREVEIVDEPIAAAIFDAEAERHDDIANGIAIRASDPRPREGLAADDLQQRRFPVPVEGMTVLEMKRAGEADEDIAIGLAGRVELDVHRSHLENAAMPRHFRKIERGRVMRWFPALAVALACGVVIQAYPSAAALQEHSNCREFTSNVRIDGRSQRAAGQACQQADGTWQIVQGGGVGAGAAPQQGYPPQGYGYPAPSYAAYPYPYPYAYPYAYPYPAYWGGWWGAPFTASFFFGGGGFHHFGHGGFHHFAHGGFHHGGGMGGHHH
jgi:surface antigen